MKKSLTTLLKRTLLPIAARKLCDLKEKSRLEKSLDNHHAVGSDGIAMIFAIMAIGGVVGAGFVGYLDSLSRGSNNDFESIFFLGTMAIVKSNVNSILTNTVTLDATQAGNSPSNMDCLLGGCAQWIPGSGILATNIDLYVPGSAYYLYSTHTDGFLASGWPCALSFGNANIMGGAGQNWTATPLTNSLGVCIMQPMIGWSPSCTGSNSFGEWQHTNSNYSGAAPPTYPACLGYNDGGSIAAPPYWAQSIISFQLFSSGVPSNFSMPFGGFNSLGYPTYLGSQDIPIPNAQADIQVVPNVIFDYVSSRFGY